MYTVQYSDAADYREGEGHTNDDGVSRGGGPGQV